MAEQLTFKYGSTIEGKTPNSGDLIAINESIDPNSTAGSEKFGSIYKGDKILGTTVADNLVIKKPITVTGVTVGNFNNGDKLSAGTSVADILKQILMKEIDVTATKPTVTINNTTIRGGVHEVSDKGRTGEVGTEINVNLGHKYTDGEFTGKEGYDYTLPAGCAKSTIKYRKDKTDMSTNTETITLQEGDISYDCLIAHGASTNTPKTNFGNNSSVNIPASSIISSNQIVFTGVYKYFMGYSKNTSASQFNSASVRALTTKTGNIIKDETTTIIDGTAITSNGNSIVIACPSKYKLATVQNGMGANILDNFSSKDTVSVVTGTVNTNYTVYVYPITNSTPVEIKNVTLKLNE